LLGRILTVAIALLWIASMTWMVRREVLPPLRAEREAARAPNYAQLESLAARAPVVQMGIFLANGKRIGWTRGALRRVGDDLLIESRTFLRLDLGAAGSLAPGLGGGTLQLYIQFKAQVVEGRLAGFDLVVRPGRRAEALASIEGHPVDDRLVLRIRQGDRIRVESFPFDTRQVLSSDLLPGFTAGRVRPGERWTIRTLDPVTYRLRAVEAEVVGREMISVAGAPREAWLIRIPYDTYEVKVWATPEGEVLQQKIPGFLLVREEPTPEEDAGESDD